MYLTTILLEAIYQSNGYVMERYGENSARLIPSSEQQYYMPSLIVNDLSELEEALQEYIDEIQKGNLKFYKLDENHRIKN